MVGYLEGSTIEGNYNSDIVQTMSDTEEETSFGAPIKVIGENAVYNIGGVVGATGIADNHYAWIKNLEINNNSQILFQDNYADQQSKTANSIGGIVGKLNATKIQDVKYQGIIDNTYAKTKKNSSTTIYNNFGLVAGYNNENVIIENITVDTSITNTISSGSDNLYSLNGVYGAYNQHPTFNGTNSITVNATYNYTANNGVSNIVAVNGINEKTENQNLTINCNLKLSVAENTDQVIKTTVNSTEKFIYGGHTNTDTVAIYGEVNLNNSSENKVSLQTAHEQDSFVQDADNLSCITEYKGTASTVYIPKYIGNSEITTFDSNGVTADGGTVAGVFKSIVTYFECGASKNLSNLYSSGQSRTALLSTDGSTMYAYAVALTQTAYTTEDSCTVVAPEAFSYAQNLISVDLNNVTTVDNYAFSNNTKIESIDTDKLQYINSNAFSGCSALHSLENLSYLETIGDNAFENCTNLTTLSSLELLITIGENAFNGSGLKNIQDLNSLKDISSSNFTGCPIETITGLTSLKGISDNAFENCTTLKSITGLENLTSVASSAFSGCTSLETVSSNATTQGVNLPKLTSLEYNAFKDCTSLEIINDLHSLSSIVMTNDYYCFNGCTNLTEIGESAFQNSKLSSDKYIELGLVNITTIGDYAFSNCVKFGGYDAQGDKYRADIDLSKVTSIGEYAFENTSITSITLSTNLTSMGVGCFKGCANVTTITTPIVQQYQLAKMFGKSDNSSSLLTNSSLGLTNLSLTIIGTKVADYGCYGLGISSINISNTVQEIGKWAFAYSDVVTEKDGSYFIELSSSVTKINEFAFYRSYYSGKQVIVYAYNSKDDSYQTFDVQLSIIGETNETGWFGVLFSNESQANTVKNNSPLNAFAYMSTKYIYPGQSNPELYKYAYLNIYYPYTSSGYGKITLNKAGEKVSSESQLPSDLNITTWILD